MPSCPSSFTTACRCVPPRRRPRRAAMFESFVHPWMFVAGALLISAPIIIHLINRIRFKRIRWAAMEFLLKSQKRNRRRLILEQLLLLALRCLLILLAGFLVARFIGATADTGAGTT